MFCTNCGAETQDDAKFCVKCGKPLEEISMTNNTAAIPKINLPKVIKLGNKKLLTIGAAALAVIILITALSVTLSGRKAGLSSPEEACEAYFDGYSHADFDRMLKSYPQFFIEDGDGKDSLIKGIQNNYDNQFGKYVEQGYEFKYNATGYLMLEKDAAKRVEDTINSIYDSDESLSDVALVDFEIIMKLDGKVKGTPSYHAGGYAFKYKGKWYYINLLDIPKE